MGQYPTPAAEGVVYYKGIDKDPIKVVTSALIYNIDTNNSQLAKGNYEDLLKILTLRGRKGKDIRYVANKLNKLGRDGRISDSKGVAELVHRYVNQLPKPLTERREVKSNGLEGVLTKYI